MPHYAFDALVIAIYGDDLARGYSYLHYDGPNAYIGYFPTRAASDADFFANYLPRMTRHTAVVESGEKIDAIVASLRGHWQWPGFKIRSIALLETQGRRLFAGHLHTRPAAAVAEPAHDAIDLTAIEAAYGPTQFALLRQIMAYCREKNIPVVMASIPSREEAKQAAATKGAQEGAHQRETRALAEAFGALYMDGAAPFASVDADDIDRRYWLKYDGHWNQAGSEIFAGAMTKFLLAHQGELDKPVP